MVAVAAVVAYFADPSHLTFLSGSVAIVVASILSAVESSLKASSDGSKALFGVAKIKR